MKRTYTLIVLLGLVIGTLVTGCNNSGTDSTTTHADTNAPAASTNQ